MGLSLVWISKEHFESGRMKAERVSLVVVPSPQREDPLVIAPTCRGIVIKGGAAAGLILECGSCLQAMAEGVNQSHLYGLTIRCSTCGVYNEVMK